MSVKCGTDHGWYRHRQLGEDPCHVCDVAHKESVAAWAKARFDAANAPSSDGGRRRLVIPIELVLNERSPYGGGVGTRCGTAAGYLRHRHLGTTACTRCRKAWDKFSDQPGSGRPSDLTGHPARMTSSERS